MNFDLCIGGGEIFWEFKDEDVRDLVWENLLKNHGWEPEWAECRGAGKHSARYHIIIYAELMPLSYRWHCVFDK
jgi:hypothetical protein